MQKNQRNKIREKKIKSKIIKKKFKALQFPTTSGTPRRTALGLKPKRIETYLGLKPKKKNSVPNRRLLYH